MLVTTNLREDALAASSPSALQAQVQAVFDNANALADEIGGVERGMNVLLGPPLLRPPLMIVSLQGAGADGTRQRTWPNVLLYSRPELDINPNNGRQNPFGVCLRKDFESAGLSRMLQEQVVASRTVAGTLETQHCVNERF
jgi:hypothetical protein